MNKIYCFNSLTLLEYSPCKGQSPETNSKSSTGISKWAFSLHEENS